MNFSREPRSVAASGRHPRQLTAVVKYDNIEVAMAETRKTRPVSWIKTALKDFQEFPEGAKGILLGALTIAAEGGKADIAKPLHGFGSGVLEIALAYRGDAFRVVYAVQLADEIWVIHAFQKKSKQGIKTPKHQIDLVKDRLKRLKEALR
jgi:phage-related protein